MNTDSMNVRKRQFYTARDKVFFTKITEYMNKIHLHIDSTRKIEEQKKNFIRYM